LKIDFTTAHSTIAICKLPYTPTWINRLIGDENEPWDGVVNGQWPQWLLTGNARPTKRLTFTTHRFYRQGDPLVPSGLLGPVRLLK